MESLAAFNLSREELFIILCCRQMAGVNSLAAINDLLAQNLDWNFLESIIRRHAISGFVYGALNQCGHCSCVPHGLINKVRRQGLQTAFRNHLYTREFNTLVKKCNHEQIRIVPLKGIAFLRSIYAHNTALRSLSDIDILVENSTVKNVENILLSMGYQPKQTSARYRRRAFHSIYSRRVSGFTIPIEVHWDIDHTDSPYAININDCWQRSRAITDKAGVHYELSIEDNLILNCFHILRHARKGPDTKLALKNFCDIANLITLSNMKIDWECLLRHSRDYKVLRPVAMALQLVRNLLGVTAISLDVFEALKGEEFQDAFEMCIVQEYLFGHRNAKKNFLPFWMADLATKTTLRDKIKIFLNIPNIIIDRYNARYFRSSHPSAIRTIANIAWYYMKKITRTVALWVFSPKKTRQQHQTMINRNIKTNQMIEWLRR